MDCFRSLIIIFIITCLNVSLVHPQQNNIKINLISNGHKLNAEFYPAAGETYLATVVLLHGYPGSEGDTLGLGDKLSANGINVLTFNYQGTWSSEGRFSFESSMQDVRTAIKFLKLKEVVNKFKIDTNNIIVVGHSYGGAMALTAALNFPEIKRIISIAGADESVFGRKMKSNPQFRKIFSDMLNKSQYPTGPVKFNFKANITHWLNHLDDYDLVKYAEKLKDRDILLLGGWNDQAIVLEEHILPLFRKLQQLKSKQVKIEVFNTNHSFGNVKKELNKTILAWIKK